jgi:hypothetical protein
MGRYVFSRQVSYSEFYAVEADSEEEALQKIEEAGYEGVLDEYSDGQSDTLEDPWEYEREMSAP